MAMAPIAAFACDQTCARERLLLLARHLLPASVIAEPGAVLLVR